MRISYQRHYRGAQLSAGEECGAAGWLLDWVLIKVGGSNAKLEGLEVGTRYAFRVAAVGGTEGRSPWSLEVERVAG
ncbi:fibronectin type III domain-containing protein [Prosthecobacter debontii]|uniref:fibronectin type III domain-containing protein n=1 Tax=Prosthecobacter debontii TaxID=48467 RepID=UPI00158FCCFA|nr:fibronectin type III domain-containing protein [Prosthecobacter debontii]